MRWPEPTWARLFFCGLASRILTVIAGLLLAPSQLGPQWLPIQLDFRDTIRTGPFGSLEPWYRFDAHFYYELAQNGYGPPSREATAAFLPLLPLAMAGLDRCGVPYILSGLFVPNLSFAFGLAIAGRLAMRIFQKRSTAWIGCGLLMTYPFSFYFSAPYQESLYFLLAAAGYSAWVTHRTELVALSWFGASLSRLTAVAFPIGLALELLADRRWPRRSEWAAFIAVGLGIGSFMLYCQWTLGNAMVHFQAHQLWGRESPSLSGLARGIRSGFHEFVFPEVWYSLSKPIAWLTFALLGIRGFWRHGPVWGCLILVPIVQATSTGTLMSMERIVLCCFPAFFEAAEVIEDNPRIGIAWFILSVPLQVFFLWLFVSNVFVN